VQGAQLASDNAADPAYSGGWTNGSNGGTGWGGGWILLANNSAGYYIGSSTANNPSGDLNHDGDINTPANATGSAWGLFFHGTGFADAVRPFAGSLAIGQTFLISMDNGNTSQVAGFGLQNSSGDYVWKFFLSASAPGYVVDDGANDTLLSIIPTREGLRISFTLTGQDSYSATITELANVIGGPGGSQTITGTLDNNGDEAITQVQLFNSPGVSPANDVFFNSMSIIPEPSCYWLTITALLSLLLVHRKRQVIQPYVSI
jgi:hypothetical protein